VPKVNWIDSNECSLGFLARAQLNIIGVLFVEVGLVKALFQDAANTAFVLRNFYQPLNAFYTWLQSNRFVWFLRNFAPAPNFVQVSDPANKKFAILFAMLILGRIQVKSGRPLENMSENFVIYG